MKTRPATMADVGKLAGVSPMTVSRALRPDTSVSTKTREKIEKAAKELGYLIDSNAAGFASRRTGFVAVTIPSINNANFADTLRGLTDGLKQSGLQVLLGYTNYDVAEEERLVEQLLKRRPEAIVVTGGNHTPHCRALLQNAGIPVLEIWDDPADPVDTVIGFSNAGACALIVEHLVAQGHTRIGFLGSDETRDRRGKDRHLGFVEALERHGLVSDRTIFSAIAPSSMREGAACATQLLDRWPDTQAIMCVSDLVAFGAMSQCQRRGLKVPQDIAICGFGAYDLSEFAVPAITTIDVGAGQIGATTAQTVLDRLMGNTPNPSRILLTPKVIVRESSAS